MDVFIIDKEEYQAGDNVRGIDKIIWVERYNKPGEFEIFGEPLGLKEALPIGSFISHSQTNEVMVVENHIIDEDLDTATSPKILITGRSVSAYIMENRVVTLNYYEGDPDPWATNDYDPDTDFSRFPMIYDKPVSRSWNKVATLLTDYLVASSASAENVPNLYIVVDDTFGTLVDTYQIQRKTWYDFEYLDKAVYDILETIDLGLRVERPGPERTAYSFDDGSFLTTLFFTIHKGLYKAETVKFDWSRGDIKKARYIWRDREDKNAYYSGAKNYAIRNFYGKSGWDLHLGKFFSDDIPHTGEEDPTQDNNATALLGVEGRILTAKTHVNGFLSDAVVSEAAGPKYGIDYQIGDIVSVFGNYGVNQDMRVIECATTVDQGIVDSIPTLAPAYIKLSSSDE